MITVSIILFVAMWLVLVIVEVKSGDDLEYAIGKVTTIMGMSVLVTFAIYKLIELSEILEWR